MPHRAHAGGEGGLRVEGLGFRPRRVVLFSDENNGIEAYVRAMGTNRMDCVRVCRKIPLNP